MGHGESSSWPFSCNMHVSILRGMPRDARRGTRGVGRHEPAPPAAKPRIATGWTILVPILVAVILNLPNLGLGHFGDDFYFLTSQSQGAFRNYFLPDPSAAFYRPIPQGAYFALLRLADPTGGGLCARLAAGLAPTRRVER